MNGSHRSSGTYLNSIHPSSVSTKSPQYSKYSLSSFRRTQTTDLPARSIGLLCQSNTMNTSYRDGYRPHMNKNDVLSTRAVLKNQSDARPIDQNHRAYHTKSSSGDRPLNLPQYLSTGYFGGAITTKSSVPPLHGPNPDALPNGELSRLTLKDRFIKSSLKSTGEISVHKTIRLPLPSPSPPQGRSSPESSPEMVKSAITSNSSNNSSAPRVSGVSQPVYIHEGFRRSGISSDGRGGGLVGLNNLGNTCFMNSIIQCLSNTEPLLEYCLRGRYLNDKNPGSSMHGSLFASYASLMKDLWNPDLTDLSTSPHQFKTQIQRFAPRFVGYSQQDSQEFLRYLLEGLHIEVNRVSKRPPPITPDYAAEDKLPDKEKAEIYWNRYLSMDNSEIVDLFVGQLMSTLECSECGFKSTTFDPFWDLSLPIPKKPNVTIMDCLRLFTSKDDLDGNERPVCGRCKVRRRCSKSFSIQKFPRILVLHLKRFSGERFRSKMSVLVDFPIVDLNLSEFASPSCQQRRLRYNLYAVSNHSGSVYAGHYTATCKHPYRNSWYEYNDSR